MGSGAGLILTEFSIADELVGRFRAWHSDEHIGERLAIEGVRSARRYVSLMDRRAFCAWYQAETADVFASPAYRALFANQSPLTQEMMAGLKGTRFVGDIVHEEGKGYGGLASRLRFTLDAGDDEVVAAWFEDVSPTLRDDPGVQRMTLARPRREAAGVDDPNWLLVLEGAEEASLARISEKVERAVPAEVDEVASRLYRLEHLLV